MDNELKAVVAQLDAVMTTPKAIETKMAESKQQKSSGLSESDGLITVGDMAKLLQQNGFETGQKRFFELLRQEGFLMKREGIEFNMPTQRSMELGLFLICEKSLSIPGHKDLTVRKAIAAAFLHDSFRK